MLLDGQSMQALPVEQVRAAIGFVQQETFLFSDTIAHNVSFGAPDATEQQIADAASIAHIRAEILEFPKGFETMVGERGVTLSGGQKQRTAIARALVRNPRILILDDALASVDTYTEEQILSRLLCSWTDASPNAARMSSCLPIRATTRACLKSSSWKRNWP